MLSEVTMRRGRVVEVQEIAAHPGVDGVEQRIRGQRAGGDDDAALRDLRYLTVDHFDIRVVPDLFGDGCGERLAVHRQCTACLDAVRVRAGQNKAVQTAQLLLEQARRVGELIRAQRVRADKLCEIVRVMRRAVLLTASSRTGARKRRAARAAMQPHSRPVPRRRR